MDVNKNKNRQSNIELLRIISMFMVLIVHADYLALGAPTISQYEINHLNAITRSIIESLSIGCVNIFILISGWFGIKASIKGLFGFLFQCLYFSFGLCLLGLLFGSQITISKMVGSIFFSSYWFIPAYLALYILSPILNSFLENSNKKRIGLLLINLYIFQTIYGLSGIAKFIDFGYSSFSFVCLYILSRYIKKCLSEIPYNKWNYLLCYIISSIILTISFFAGIKTNINFQTYTYINPIVIINSISLFIFFVKLQIRNSIIINFIASSSFAVFLLHLHKECGLEYFILLINAIYNSFNGFLVLILLFCLLSSIFIIAIVIDQPRKYLWNFISKLFYKYKWYFTNL